MEQIKNFLAGVDPSIWYVVAIIAVILLVISLVKKAVKLVVFLAIAAVAFLLLAPASSSLRNYFNVEKEDGAIIITLNGEEHTIADKEDIKSITITDIDEDTLNLNIVYSEENLNVDLPKFTEKLIEKGLESLDLKYEYIE